MAGGPSEGRKSKCLFYFLHLSDLRQLEMSVGAVCRGSRRACARVDVACMGCSESKITYLG